jgi:cell division protein FtsB
MRGHTFDIGKALLVMFAAAMLVVALQIGGQRDRAVDIARSAITEAQLAQDYAATQHGELVRQRQVETALRAEISKLRTH